jgi:hypothetical protein
MGIWNWLFGNSDKKKDEKKKRITETTGRYTPQRQGDIYNVYNDPLSPLNPLSPMYIDNYAAREDMRDYTPPADDTPRFDSSVVPDWEAPKDTPSYTPDSTSNDSYSSPSDSTSNDSGGSFNTD